MSVCLCLLVLFFFFNKRILALLLRSRYTKTMQFGGRKWFLLFCFIVAFFISLSRVLVNCVSITSSFEDSPIAQKNGIRVWALSPDMPGEGPPPKDGGNVTSKFVACVDWFFLNRFDWGIVCWWGAWQNQHPIFVTLRLSRNFPLTAYRESVINLEGKRFSVMLPAPSVRMFAWCSAENRAISFEPVQMYALATTGS